MHLRNKSAIKIIYTILYKNHLAEMSEVICMIVELRVVTDFRMFAAFDISNVLYVWTVQQAYEDVVIPRLTLNLLCKI